MFKAALITIIKLWNQPFFTHHLMNG
jgi:hypothetical protein